MRIAISSGHGLHVRGASGILDEVNEARRVTNRVAEILRERGHEAAVFHDDTSRTVGDNLNAIIAWHGARMRDIDVSVHFNAFHDPNAHGTEVLYSTEKSAPLAEGVALAMSAAGFRLRPAQGGATRPGTVLRNNLAFLNRLASCPAVLLEVCFVTARRDADIYNANFEALCKYIAAALN